jgi:hypothetical protein
MHIDELSIQLRKREFNNISMLQCKSFSDKTVGNVNKNENIVHVETFKTFNWFESNLQLSCYSENTGLMGTKFEMLFKEI